MINKDKLIGAFLNFIEDLENGVEHGIDLGDGKVLVNPLWDKIKEYNKDEYLKEGLLAEIYGTFAMSEKDYFSWLKKSGLDPKNRLIFLVLHHNALYNEAVERDSAIYKHLKDTFFAFFNLILFNSKDKWKKERSKKKSAKSS